MLRILSEVCEKIKANLSKSSQLQSHIPDDGSPASEASKILQKEMFQTHVQRTRKFYLRNPETFILIALKYVFNIPYHFNIFQVASKWPWSLQV